MNISSIHARQILDSRGTPTVEVDVYTAGGGFGRAAVPSGASTGIHEAHELRDEDEAYNGKGVLHAVSNVHEEIAPTLCGIPADDQFRIDDTLCALDGTENKSRLGANALLAVSLATSHAAANTRAVPLFRHINDIAHNPPMSLPMPMFNVLNGGAHASNSADFQEYMVVPLRAKTYARAVQIVTEVFHTLKQFLKDRDFATTVGDEGGFAPHVASNTDMLDILTEACTTAGYTPKEDVGFALDVAASEFLHDERYALHTEDRTLSADEMIDYLSDITDRYPILSVEDGLSEDAWESWTTLTECLSHIQIVGDDLLVTNPDRLDTAIARRAGNAILIKPNQIGTLTETIRTIKTAKAHGWRTIVSHRSGETEDVTITHLAVGTGAGQIKTGSVSRGERTAKHNELLRIEEQNIDLSLAHPFRYSKHLF